MMRPEHNSTCVNRCDLCGRELRTDDGGLCPACMFAEQEEQAIIDERNREWWADNPVGEACS